MKMINKGGSNEVQAKISCAFETKFMHLKKQKTTQGSFLPTRSSCLLTVPQGT